MIPILLYHSIAGDLNTPFKPWSLRPEVFNEQLSVLRDRGYTPVTVSQMARAMISPEAALPEKPVVITFDDGFNDFATMALPALVKCGFSATLYVVTHYVNGTSRWLNAEGERDRALLTWDQLGEISQSGIEIGAHSHTHPQLDTLAYKSARVEVFLSKDILEQHLCRTIETFAYPHGYYSRSIRHLAMQAGYTSACAVKNAMSSLGDDRFALARLKITSGMPLDEFLNRLEGKGVEVAPKGEKVRTKVWRLARRSLWPFMPIGGGNG